MKGSLKVQLLGGRSGVLLLALSGPIAAGAGDLDPTFSTDGVTTTPIAINSPYLSDSAYQAALQSDGKIIAVGSAQRGSGGYPSNRMIAVARYDTSGVLDTTFGAAGIVTTTIGGIDNFARAIAVQPDDKILVAGLAENTGWGYDFSLVRYTKDGALDSTFDGDGIVSTEFSSHWNGNAVSSHAAALALQTDGKIIAAGNMDYAASGDPYDQKFALARYNADGSLDTTFDTDGKVTTNFWVDASYSDKKNESATAVAVQDDDGKIVAVGQAWTGSKWGFALARYNADGSLDTDFSTDGMVVTSIGDGGSASAVVVLPDGKILVGGSSTASGGTHGDFTVVRYDSNGNVDTSFGDEGVARADFGETSVLIGLARDAGGGIIASGYSYDATSHGYFALARFDSAGALDTSFGTGGLVKTDFGFTNGDGAYGEGLVIQPSDGKIVQVGDCRANDNDPDFCVARFETLNARTLKGFYQPVDMGGVWNVVKGGATVPLKFEVFAGSTELADVAVIDSFTVTGVACPGSSADTDQIEFTTTGGTSLRYDPLAGQFIQNWQTPKKPGFCYTVTMTADDGSTLVANFKLK